MLSINVTQITISNSSASSYPSKAELLSCLPAELLELNQSKAWRSLFSSLGLSLLGYGLGTQIPLVPGAAPLWIFYGMVTGTMAGGCWVIAHECGHHAFHPNRRVEALVGFVLHSLLLVPCYTWQRSHAVHHAHCNHLEEGETHVPPRADSSVGRQILAVNLWLGPALSGVVSLVNHLLLGWPLYLLFGVAGGSDYGSPTSHFWHGKPFRNGRRLLFSDSFRSSMWLSNLGVLAMLVILGLAAMAWSPARVLCVVGLPYLVINAWLVGYTWLQHTDVDIPHFSRGDWTWAKGALQTVDRPYGPILNFLHHGIGSTHVCHHVNPRIPHYNAWRGTTFLRQHYPHLIRYDSTPIPQALWRIACRCAVVSQNISNEGFFYQPQERAKPDQTAGKF